MLLDDQASHPVFEGVPFNILLGFTPLDEQYLGKLGPPLPEVGLHSQSIGLVIHPFSAEDHVLRYGCAKPDLSCFERGCVSDRDLNYPSSFSLLPGVGPWSQQSQQRCKDFNGPCHLLQCIWWYPEVFHGQPKGVVSVHTQT